MLFTADELFEAVAPLQSNVYESGAFSEFVVAQLRRIAVSVGMPYEELIADIPESALGYSSARIALLQSPYTPLSRPLNVRFP